MNIQSTYVSEMLDTITDKTTFLDYVRGHLEALDGEPLSTLDHSLMLVKAQELRCKKKFTDLYTDYRNEQLQYMPEVPPYIVIKNDKAAVDPVALADYIADTQHYIFVQAREREDKRLFWYENGVYRRISVSLVKAKIKEIISEYNRSLATVKAIEETYKQIGYTRDRHYIPNDEILDGNPNIINFENGILYLDTMTLDAHSPEHLCTVQIPCKWSSEIKETPVFDKFLEHLARGEEAAKQTLLEFIGFVVSNIPVEKFKKSLFLIGKGNSGKTQFIKMLCTFIGTENYCALPFSKLEARFQIANLYRKRLAADDDCRAVNSSEVSVFKSITGGGEVSAEEKGLMSFPFVYKGGYIVAANDTPLFGGDKGSHVYERIITIACGDSIPEEKQDKYLLDKLYSERQGILTKAVFALKEAIKRNYRFTIGENTRALTEKYKEENDSVLKFISECCETITDTSKALPAPRVWIAFKEWCEVNNEFQPRRKDFTRAIAYKYNIPEYEVMKKSGDNRYYPFTLKPEYQEEYHIYDCIQT